MVPLPVLDVVKPNPMKSQNIVIESCQHLIRSCIVRTSYSDYQSLLRTARHLRIHPPIVFIVRLNDDRIPVHEFPLNRDQEYGFVFLPDLFSDGFRDKEERDTFDLLCGA